MERPKRFELEVRAVVVSWKAAVRALRVTRGADDASAEGEDRLGERALGMLDALVERYPDLAAEPQGTALLLSSRDQVRRGDVSAVSGPMADMANGDGAAGDRTS